MKQLIVAALGLMVAFASSFALAVPPDFTSLTTAVDYSTAITAILSVFAALAGVAIVWKGGKMILRALGFA